jgi:uncharacterized protein (TIGR02145 family)
MKKSYFIALMSVLVLTGCGEGKDEKSILDVNQTAIPADYKAGEYTIEVTSDDEWQVDYYEKWATITPTSGTNNGVITITVSENTTFETRKAEIWVKSADHKVNPIKITITQSYEELEFAYSNIYLDGDKLTFATEPDAEKEQYQGLLFKWGSLLGISPAGENGSEFSIYDIAFKPSEYSLGIIDPDTGWEIVPYDKYSVGQPQEDASLGLGDICRYISKKGWVQGKWRMPDSNEYDGLAKNGKTKVGTWEPISGNSSGTYKIAHGSTLGEYKVFFPASGCRLYYSGALDSAGTFGAYWTADAVDNNYHTDAYSWLLEGQHLNNYLKYEAYPIRCIADKE